MAYDVQRVIDAAAQYPRHYDDVFLEVGERARRDGAIGKTDLAALITWKRAGQGRWVQILLSRPESDVRAATRAAFASNTDQGALDALSVLPGFRRRAAIATVPLCAHDPSRFAVVDRRALDTLTQLGCTLDNTVERTVAYWHIIRELVSLARGRGYLVTARDVDKGLFMLGG